MTLRVGLVGCGLIGQKRVRALPSGSRLVGLYDIDPDRAATLAVQLGDHELVANSLAELLEARAVDLVIVATIHDQLAPIALEAVRAGCHVLIEKPGACDPDSLRSVRDEAAARGLVVRVGYNHRFHPSFVKLRDLHSRRDDGEVLHIRARYGHGGRVGYEHEWRADRSRSGGGELVDQGSHLIDLSRHVIGPLSLAFAELPTRFWPMEVEDNAFIALRHDSGAVAWLHASWTEWKNLFSFEVTYRRAKYEVTGLGGSYGPEQLTLYAMRPELGPPMGRTWIWPPGDESWGLELEDMFGAIGGQIGAGATIDDAIAVLSLVHEAYQDS